MPVNYDFAETLEDVVPTTDSGKAALQPWEEQLGGIQQVGRFPISGCHCCCEAWMEWLELHTCPLDPLVCLSASEVWRPMMMT